MFETPGLQTASNDLRGQPITSDLKFVFRGLNNLCSSASLTPIVLYLTNLPGRPIIIPRAAYSYLVAAKKKSGYQIEGEIEESGEEIELPRDI